MNEDEARIERHLRHVGYTDAVYEPDGNVPPDFLVNGQIAIEVRRLNENEDVSAPKLIGLDQQWRYLAKQMRELLASMGPAGKVGSVYVGFDFKRPIEEWKTLGPKVRAFLSSVAAVPPEGLPTIHIAENFTLDLLPARKPRASRFLFVGGQDDDLDGFPTSAVIRNLRAISTVKLRSVAPFRSRYSVWWLMLVDHIAFGHSPEDREEVREAVADIRGWDRIVIVDRDDVSRWFDVLEKSD